jgi:hypothetical protein
MFCFAVIKRKYNQLTNVNINSSVWRSLRRLTRSQTISIDNLSSYRLVRVGAGFGTRLLRAAIHRHEDSGRVARQKTLAIATG